MNSIQQYLPYEQHLHEHMNSTCHANDAHIIHPALREARHRMSHRWAADGLDPESEVQSFLDLAFSICPHSPYAADRFVQEVGRPPANIIEWVWDQVRWPQSGAAVPKVHLLAIVVWDLRQWAGQMREEPEVFALRVRRGSIKCFGTRPKPIAKHLSKDLSQNDERAAYFGRQP